MTLNSIMGIIASVALFCPVLFILVLRLGAYRTFPALLFYYATVFIYNLMTEGHIAADPEIIRYWGLFNNLLDTPLMLTFLLYFSPSASFSKRIKILTVSFVLFEILVVSIIGLNTDAITIILGPGILILCWLFVYFFTRQTKIAIMYNKGAGKALIAAALLFAYGCYIIIYLMYYIFKTQYVADTFLVYFMVITVSSILLAAGIIVEEKRIRKLKELKITRRELSGMYANETKAAPLKRTARLDFDSELWN